MSTAADDMDFSWLDDEAPPAKKKPGPPKGRKMTPEQRAKYRNNGAKKGRENATTGKMRLADGTIVRKSMTEKRWQRAVEFVASGTPVMKIWKKIDVTAEIFNAYLISNVGAMKQLNEARLLWLRREWSLVDIDAILDRVSMGQTVKSACKDEGFSDSKVASFYRLMRGDRVMREVYDAARELQAESWLDDSIDIADDKTADRYTDDKGNERVNTEVIQRSKLRIEQRNWSSGVLHRKRFGDHKHIDHGGDITVNHAALLTGARKRLEQVQQKRGVTVEGEASVVDRSGAQQK